MKVVANNVDPEFRARLLIEAEAGARLQHPAIATFYESNSSEDGAFIAMEYVRGRTLRDVLGAGAVPTDEAIAIVCSLLEALHHAHAAGILHRDIKPENIMLTAEGAPKLLDFGLAKALFRSGREDAATVADLTGGRILGTVGYMSPEQLRGEELGPASDIFAVGAVLYELLAGRPAFPGARPTERIAAILSQDPAPLDIPGIPSALWPVIQRALAKPRAARYESVSTMLSDLRAVTEGATVASSLPQSLAVFDFRNLSRQSDDDWIGSGIAESVIADLSRVAGLTLVGRDKILAALRAAGVAGGDQSARALSLGATLGCRWVLLGSFQRVGSTLRVTSQLTDVATAEVVAAEKLDGPVDTLFDMQDRLSAAVLERLNLELPAAPPGVIQRRDLHSFECYARGRRLWQRLEKGTFDQARELYEKAIAEQPGYAPALSGLAALHAMRFTFTTDTAELDEASSYARRAIAADPQLADPHIWLGYALMRRGRMDEALQEELRAAELDPTAGYAPYFAGCVEQFRGRSAAAMPFLQRAIERDPLHGFAWVALAWAHQSIGNLSECQWCLQQAVDLETAVGAKPTAGANGFMGECLRLQGRFAEARAACLAGIDAAERSDHMYRDTFRAVSLCSLGRTALDEGDTAAAHAALTQVVAQIRGRDRALGGGYLLVQALAGLSRCGGGEETLAEALRLFRERDRFNFSIFWTWESTPVDLARASIAFGVPADELLVSAREAGSFEAGLLLGEHRQSAS